MRAFEALGGGRLLRSMGGAAMPACLLAVVWMGRRLRQRGQ